VLPFFLFSLLPFCKNCSFPHRHFDLVYDCELDEEYDSLLAFSILSEKLEPSSKKDRGFEQVEKILRDKEKCPKMGDQSHSLMSAYWIAMRKTGYFRMKRCA